MSIIYFNFEFVSKKRGFLTVVQCAYKLRFRGVKKVITH